GIIGLLGAACGTDRSDDEGIRRLAGLRMAVRVDREGLVEQDYHTTQNVPNTSGKNHRTVVSHRYYLADALFLVRLAGEAGHIAELAGRVRRPHWRLHFGRKAFVPAGPLIEERRRGEPQRTGVFRMGLEEVLYRHPWLDDRGHPGAADPPPLRTVVDTEAGDPLAEPRYDVPVSFRPDDRRFSARAVRAETIPFPETDESWPRVPE